MTTMTEASARFREFKMPDVGEGLTEAEVLKWYVQPGEAVTDGQVVCDLDSRPVRGRRCLRRVEPRDCRDAPDAARQDQLCVDRAPGPDERDRVEPFEHVSEPG